MKLAVIPARGGSKRIPRKNLQPFCGRPIIAWSIAAAQASGCFDRIVVSTDDEEIARAAVDAGAEVPFMRPARLADDHTPTIPVVAHAIEQMRAAGELPDAVCCIYATAAFVRTADLKEGLRLLEAERCMYAFSVTSFPSPIQRAFRIAGDGRVEMFHPELFSVRSQELEPAYHDAAQFYWGRADAWLSGQPIFSHDAVPVVLPRQLVQDIDTPEDWATAEWMFRALHRLPPTAGQE
jgi:N-acylneuraminate cytidylyltransferase